MEWAVEYAATKGFAAGEADKGWAVPGVKTEQGAAGFERAFDIKSIAAGVITLKNCAWQIGSQYFTSTDEPTVEASSGIVCAVINRETGGVTAEIDAEWDEAAPELIPLALYKISRIEDVVTVLFDMRGGMISLHE
jgi:hypothetical protein